MRKWSSWLAVMVLLSTLIGGRANAFPSGGALPPVLTLVIPVAGLNGVPLDAAGAAMNVTVTSPAAAGYLTVYPCGDAPVASNLNYVTDQTVPNFVISRLSPDGDVCIDTIAVTDIIVDLAGYIPSGSSIVTLPQPARIVDTREGLGLPPSMVFGHVAEVQVAGTPGVPPDASMVLFNATVVNTASAGHLTVFPCGQPLPETSTLNYAAGEVVPNFVVTRVGTAGRVCLYSTAATDVVIDLAGFVPAGASDVVPLFAPARLLDTRVGIGGPSVKLSSAERSLQLAGVGGIPDTATAVLVNLTATRATVSGFIAGYPCGGVAPVVSNLNFSPGRDIANSAIIKLGGGQLCLRSNADVDVIVDVTGFLNSDASITALTPVRIYDSREGVDPPCNLGVAFTVNGFVIIDLHSGNPIGLAHADGVQFPRAYVRGDCQHIDVAGYVPTQSEYRFWEFDTSGAIITTFTLPDYATNVIFTDAGPLILHRVFVGPDPAYWQLIDLASNQVLFTLPEPDRASDGSFRLWEPVGATFDGGLIALQLPTLDRSSTVISYWTPDGVELGEWQSPVGAFNFRLSPAGSYLAYVISSGSVTTNGYIVALDGSPVTTMPPGPNPLGPWITDGSMMGCMTTTGAQFPSRWDLFSPVKSLIPGNPFTTCLTAAG